MTDVFTTTRVVAVVLSLHEQPRVYAIDGLPETELVLGNETFRDSGAGDWLGFYDWLRTSSGRVIGVRLWADEVSDQIRVAERCAGVVAGERCWPLVIYLGVEREFADEESCDQDFGSNMLLVSTSRFALAFNAPSSIRQ